MEKNRVGRVTGNTHIYFFGLTYIGVRDRKKENKKNAKENLSTLGLFSIKHLVVLILYTKFEDSSTSKCRADIMKHFIGKKEKWTNKGTYKQYVADYLLYDTTCHTQPLYLI